MSNSGTKECKKWSLSGSDLKLIAMGSMLIDHMAASVFGRYLVSNELLDVFSFTGMNELSYIYYLMRFLGRLSFPIYIFLLIEGFEHTRNRWKYLCRLIVFAFISEIPFDLAFQIHSSKVKRGTIIEIGYQNVFFTLAIGLAVIIIIDEIGKKLSEKKVWKYALDSLTVLLGCALAYVLKTDYDFVGVAIIVIMYVTNKKGYGKGRSMLESCFILTLCSLDECTCLVDAILAKHYNGKRGLNIKILFYAFYPVHLLILGLICVAMGI